MTDIAEIWAEDKLGRQEKAEYLRAFLIGRVHERQLAGIKGAYVVNVQAEWGFGKTFFMERFFQQLSKEHPAVFINAWKSDFTDDPYTAVISEIESFFKKAAGGKGKNVAALKKAYEVMKSNAAKIFWMGLKGGLKRGSKWAIGESTDEIIELFEKHTPDNAALVKELADGAEAQLTEVTDEIIDAFAAKRIKDFQEAKESLDNFRDSMAAMLRAHEIVGNNKHLPLFVFVDELDRCRPPYAIAMLERIKHLFDIDNVVFLISTDTKQLAHSIKGVYGAGFDSQRYLQRFFNRTYTLPEANNRQLIGALLDASGTRENLWSVSPGQMEAREFLAQASEQMGMSLREIQAALDVLMSITTVWQYDLKIHLCIMYPLIYGYILGENIDHITESGWLWEQVKKLQFIHIQIGGGEFVSITNYAHTLLTVSKKTIITYMNENSQRNMGEKNMHQRWAHTAMTDEYSKRFANTNKDGKSIITKYSKIIKHAGLLTQAEENLVENNRM
ncbi:KAP family P-loop NTPase fold protein [Ensifer sp. SL37]|uniref:KAP family P-loop NTPase fold protein n=1 Tax=Ensifer sp. SL37 TaxID=2995137 RepID=UPI00227625C8|nr:P-loop NTPase fold protein [Ensifer sp. SL37]MCY1741450.1 P-loop NTPase fold protein [Ensifer sp. SL37]